MRPYIPSTAVRVNVFREFTGRIGTPTVITGAVNSSELTLFDPVIHA